MILKTTIKIILCLVFVVRSRQETPQYSYECKENGDILLHGFSINATIQLTSVNDKNFTSKPDCNNRTYSSDIFGHILIPKKCTNGENVTINRTVVFRAVDLVIDGTTTTTTKAPTTQTTNTKASRTQTKTTKSSTTQAITSKDLTKQTLPKPNGNTTSAPGGVGREKRSNILPSFGQRNHNFRIQCNLIKQGVVDHVIGHVGVKNVALLPNVFNSIGTVEMRFKSEEATKEINLEDLPDISTVYLGDKFYMYLKYIGEQDYSISPQICTAYGDSERAVVEKDIRNKKVELWNYTDCVSPMSKSFHLMHTFKNLTDRIVYAELFGFHFDIDADITIECDVKVCTKHSSDPTCTFKTECDAKDWKIVKRSTREEDNTMTVKSKLHVLERQIGNSNSAGLLHSKWTCLVVLQFMLYLY